METVAFTMLLVVTVSAQMHFGKYVYIPDALKWRLARTFCRSHFTDLLPIASLSEEERLKSLTAGKVSGKFWTGLFWNKTHWGWSGGHMDNIPPSLVNWSHSTQYSASLHLDPSSYGWAPEDPRTALPFLCVNLVIVEMKKSWEEALESCRQNHTSLISMTSRTEHRLTKRRIQQDHISDRVWIGLRFLRNRWMWVNSDPLSFQAWPEGSQDHQCPVEGRCGALNKQGLWENWDCQEKLNFICS